MANIITNPTADQTIQSDNLLPASGNTTQSLGTPGASWNATLGTTVVKKLNDVFYADQFSGADIGAQINAAVAALPSGGGTVDCRGFVGSQTVSTTIALSKPVHLILGALQLTGTVDPIISISANDVTISGEAFSTSVTQTTTTGNAIAVTPGATDICLEGVFLVAPPATRDELNLNQGNAVFVGSGNGNSSNAVSSRITVMNCKILSGNNGIVFKYVNEFKITNNRFISGTAGLAQMLCVVGNQGVISNNVFSDAEGIANAIYTRGCIASPNTPSANIAISSNQITGTYTFECINSFGSFHSVTGNSIIATGAANNTSGIVFQQSETVDDTESTSHDIAVSGNQISISGVGGNGNSGIGITGGSSGGASPFPSSYISITGNVINLLNLTGSGAMGIILIGFTDHISIGNNFVHCAQGANCEGIVIESLTTNSTVVGNNIEQPTGNGIDLQGQNSLIVGNRVANCTSGGAAGIFVGGTGGFGKDCLITDNLLYNNTGRGFSVQAGAGPSITVGFNASIGNGLPDLLDSTAISGNLSYRGVPTEGNGVPAEVFHSLNTGLAANFNGGSAETLFTPSAAGMYRISACSQVTNTPTNGTFPSLTLRWTDAGGISRTVLLWTAVGSVSSDVVTVQATYLIYTSSSTAITITSASYAAGTGTALQYDLAVTVEQL